MSNPLDPNITADFGGTVGARSSIWDNIYAGFEQAKNVDAVGSPENSALPLYEDALRTYEERTGQKTNLSPDRALVSALMQDIIDPEQRRSFGNEGPAFGIVDFHLYGGEDGYKGLEDRVAKAKQIDAQIRALGDPSIQSIEDIVKQVGATRTQYQEAAQHATETSGWLGALGQMAGGAVGRFAAGDPLAIAGLFAGGGSGGIATRIALDALAGAAFSAQDVLLNANPTRQAFGEQPIDVTSAIEQGAIGQAGAGLLLHGLGSLAGRVYSRALGGVAQFHEFTPVLDFGNDLQLRQMFEAQPDSASARAGLKLLDEQNQFDFSNPYGKTQVGTRVFTGEVSDIYNLMEGRTSTAVARFMPEPKEPFTLSEWDFEHQTVREQQPQLFNRLVEATDQLHQIDSAIAELNGRIDGLTITDAISHLDQQVGAKVSDLQAKAVDETLSPRQRAFAQRRLDETVTNFQRVDPELASRITALEQRLAVPGAEVHGKILRGVAKELDALVKQAGEPKLENAMVQLETPMRDSLAQLERDRVRAAAEFRRQRSLVDREIARNQRAREILANSLGTKPPTEPGPSRLPIDPTRLRRDVVTSNVEAATKAADAIAEEPPAAPQIDEEAGTVTLFGNQKLNLADEIIDPDSPTGRTTVAALLKAIQEDDALIEAARTCAL